MQCSLRHVALSQTKGSTPPVLTAGWMAASPGVVQYSMHVALNIQPQFANGSNTQET